MQGGVYREEQELQSGSDDGGAGTSSKRRGRRGCWVRHAADNGR